mgnify:FL=1|tara:strand:- start:79 stop:390 length:312 start_codon:yes stop_codon:yes gene_type:complete
MASHEEKRNYAREYIRQLVEIEDEMEVYKEQKRALRDSFRDQGYLTTHEIAATVRAWRLVVQANRGKLDLDDLFEQVEMFSGATRGPEATMSLPNVLDTGESN